MLAMACDGVVTAAKNKRDKQKNVYTSVWRVLADGGLTSGGVVVPAPPVCVFTEISPTFTDEILKVWETGGGSVDIPNKMFWGGGA